MKRSESTGNKYSVFLQTTSLSVTFYANILDYGFKYKDKKVSDWLEPIRITSLLH